ncbi:hypothetical protein AB4Y45_33185 [Paraburkholderia sp. EG287A]|uniref:hypothetical protein n=1 Tax=Paraburkholderia sp. EG287A TaxID=3237012 RepID=UPI0034D23177
MRVLTICALGLALLATGCERSVEVADYPLPQELSDCSLFRLQDGHGSEITVARCPNSTTSTTFREGKHDETSVIVDGPEPRALRARRERGERPSYPQEEPTRDALPSRDVVPRDVEPLPAVRQRVQDGN